MARDKTCYRGTSTINSTLHKFALFSCITYFCPEYLSADTLHVSLALCHHNTSTTKEPVPLVLCELDLFLCVSQKSAVIWQSVFLAINPPWGI